MKVDLDFTNYYLPHRIDKIQKKLREESILDYNMECFNGNHYYDHVWVGRNVMSDFSAWFSR